MKDISKYIFPALLIAAGLAFLILKITQEQNTLFLMGGLAVLLVGILSLLNAMEVINKTVRTVVFSVLVLISLGLAWQDYKSIKDPIDFNNERDRRYAEVEQRLKDIRRAEIAFKAMNGGYSANFDELLDFIRTDSFKVVKAIGVIPDSLLHVPDSAVILGIVTRDTTLMPVLDSIFSVYYLKDRQASFHLDSLPYVPYGGGAKFDLDAGQIEKNSVMVPVFLVTDSKPFDKNMVYSVGSMTEPSTSGNWE